MKLVIRFHHSPGLIVRPCLFCSLFAFLISSARRLSSSVSNPEGFWEEKSLCMCVGLRAYSAGKSPSFQQSLLAGMALLRLRNVLSYFTVLGLPRTQFKSKCLVCTIDSSADLSWHLIGTCCYLHVFMSLNINIVGAAVVTHAVTQFGYFNCTLSSNTVCTLCTYLRSSWNSKG